MKSEFTCCAAAKIPTVQITMNRSELKEYYNSIRNNTAISNEFKLNIANILLDMPC